MSSCPPTAAAPCGSQLVEQLHSCHAIADDGLSCRPASRGLLFRRGAPNAPNAFCRRGNRHCHLPVRMTLSCGRHGA